MRKLSSISVLCLFILALAVSAFAQQPFNKNEFIARRAKVFEKIPDGIAVIFAAKPQNYPIVASGPNTMTLHYSANNRQMMDGEVVYIDYGADYEYYTSDVTRTWPVSGRFTPEQEKMYVCILEARDAIIGAMKPGVTINQLKDVAEAVYKKHGFGNEFQALGRYVGHTIGISVHDVNPPDRNRPLEAGVVFNVEPLLEMPDKKIHMRLEDTVLVTPTGAVNMTAGAPAGIQEIYALIKQSALSLNR